MGLIDLILDNLFFFILLLGLISSMLAKRGKDSQTEQSKPRQSYPRPSQNRQEPFERTYEAADRRRTQTGPMTRAERVRVETVQIPTTEQGTLQKNDVNIETAEHNPYERSSETPYERPVDRPYAIRKEERSPSVFTKNGIRNGSMQGMMWSQVSGPPRSRQPHRNYAKRYAGRMPGHQGKNS